ncbi:hypothetical protein F4808DRAFT_423095 [Astrocystis sublimbata]|nr:hypothetical protein F4808DRAFT_423095 [Astrocystis sublimbata]
MATSAEEERQRRLGQELADYFARRPGIKFVGFAGLGRHGGALLMDENEGEAGVEGAQLARLSSRVRKCPTFALEFLPNGVHLTF